MRRRTHFVPKTPGEVSGAFVVRWEKRKRRSNPSRECISCGARVSPHSKYCPECLFMEKLELEDFIDHQETLDSLLASSYHY